LSTPQPGLIVILGAAATGKTRLAIDLATAWHSPILSADSRQIYRHFDIGTAKPTIAERQQVPHFLIDIAEPNTTLTLAEYQTAANALITEFHAQGITPILVGGSGLYIKAIVSGLQMPQVPPDLLLRQQLSDLGQTHCHQLLQQVDPPSGTRIHPNDTVRTLRALEVFYVTGRSLSAQQAEHPPGYPIWQLGIAMPETATYQEWIRQRVEQMLAIGWLDEVEALTAQYGADLPLLRTLGYGELMDFCAGKTDLSTAIDLIVKHTYQFGKRQRTWFRGSGHGNLPIHWLESGCNWEDAVTVMNNYRDSCLK
jgi:tRNA dimethylallyltransferase